MAWHGAAENDTRELSALPSELAAMTDRFREMEVDAASMEGTGIYREAPFDAPADAGIKATLVHARQVKLINGRKGSFAEGDGILHQTPRTSFPCFLSSPSGPTCLYSVTGLVRSSLQSSATDVSRFDMSA